MKPTIIIGVVSLLLTANALLANVGETEQQVDHRYGKPKGKWDDYLGYKKLYHWKDFNVMVTFLDGVAQREMFERVELVGLGINPRAQKGLAKMEGVGKNGVIFDESSGVFTTKPFEEKFIAARTAAWAKADEKH